jgi:hypothetical protein
MNIWSRNSWDDFKNGFFGFGIWFLGPKSDCEQTPEYKELHALWEKVPVNARIGYTYAKGNMTDWQSYQWPKNKSSDSPGEYPNFQFYKISQRIWSYSKERDYKVPGKAVMGMSRPYHGNRLIPKSFLVDHPKEAAQLFKSFEGKHCDNFYHLGGKVSTFDPDNSSVNPNFRKAIFQVGFCDKKLLQDLKERFPNNVSGNGLNHAGWHEPDWKDTNWGLERYEKLLKSKQQYDPENRFWCRHCVGSDL